MKNTYNITISDSDGILFRCTHVAEKYTANQVPYSLLDELGKRYAPCKVKCVCLNEGWQAEKAFP